MAKKRDWRKLYIYSGVGVLAVIMLIFFASPHTFFASDVSSASALLPVAIPELYVNLTTIGIGGMGIALSYLGRNRSATGMNVVNIGITVAMILLLV